MKTRSGAMARYLLVTILLSLVAVEATTANATQSSTAEVVDASLQQASLHTSELDTRQYRYIELDNGLRAILVSDPDTDKAAASLDVAVGHASDPENREGLAHLLEHMLFLGTEKYPRAGEYQEFIKDHGGSHNAYTTYGHTNYFFSVEASFLEDSLDRFAQFFIAPLFNNDLVKRERVIVDSEYSARSESEGRRSFAARRAAMNQAHPMSHFAVGSVDTLADRDGSPVRDDLIDFYKKNYSAHLMTLSVIGQQPLDVLETMVRSRFSDVRRRNATRFVAEMPLYSKDQLPILIDVKPLKEYRSLNFSFEVPSTISLYKSKPLQQIANILGHEGEGSLLAALKDRGWASALSAGTSSMDALRGTMEIEIELSKSGVQHIGEIGEMLFSTVRMIREGGLERWRFEEQKKLSEIGFRFADQLDAQSLVQTLATRLQDYPWQDALYAPYALQQYDVDLIRKYLDLIEPDNAVVTLIAPDVDTDRVDDDYGTEFSIKSLPDEWRQQWTDPQIFADLSLPKPNPFVPERLDMVTEDTASTEAETRALPNHPGLVVDVPGLEVWHQTDTRFGTPRADFYFSFKSPMAMSSARDSALADLLTQMMQDRLSAFSYPAYLAGLSYKVYPHLRGLSVRISGYSDRQSVLLARIVSSLRDDHLDPERFDRLKADLLQDYRNQLKAPPSRMAVSELQRLLIRSATPIEDRVGALEKADFSTMQNYVKAFFKRGNVLVLSVGNRTGKETQEMAGIVRDILLKGVEPTDVPSASVVRLKEGQHYQRSLASDHKDSVVGLYYQGRDESYAERARFYLYDQMVESAFYNQLRTEQKLGYIVQSFAMPILDVPGMMFLVQSPSATVNVSERAIHDFVAGYAAKFNTVDSTQLSEAREALLSRINRRDDTITDRAERYWRELDDEDYEFNSRQKLSDAVRAINLDAMREFVARLGANSSASLVLYGNGQVQTDDNDTAVLLSASEIDDYAAFKEGHAVF